jgi:hypothetical protein
MFPFEYIDSALCTRRAAEQPRLSACPLLVGFLALQAVLQIQHTLLEIHLSPSIVSTLTCEEFITDGTALLCVSIHYYHLKLVSSDRRLEQMHLERGSY